MDLTIAVLTNTNARQADTILTLVSTINTAMLREPYSA